MDAFGRSALFYVLMSPEDDGLTLELFDFLVSRGGPGGDLWKPDVFGYYPAHYAAMNGHGRVLYEMVKRRLYL